MFSTSTVLNHNSRFAVAPEWSPQVLFDAGDVGLGAAAKENNLTVAIFHIKKGHAMRLKIIGSLSTCACGFAAAIGILFSGSAAWAATYYWTTEPGQMAGGNGTWDTATANWSLSATGDNPLSDWTTTGTDTAVFSAPGPFTVTVNGNQAVGAISFAGSGYTVTGGTLTFPSSGLGTITTTQDAEIDSVIAGGVQLDKEGPGTLYLSNGGNSFANSSGILLNGGTLKFASGALNLGAGGNPLINCNGGTLQWASGNTQDVSAFISISGSNQTACLDTNTNSVQFGSIISGSGGLAKLGLGTLSLQGANTYSGGTTISVGTLVAAYYNNIDYTNNALGDMVPSNIVTVNSGAVLTVANLNWADNVFNHTDGSNAHTFVVNPGGKISNGSGTITGLGNLTMQGGTLEVNNGFNSGGWYAAYVLLGDVTVGGSSPSFITDPGVSYATIQLISARDDNSNVITAGTRTFTVANVTGGGADLTVAARLSTATAPQPRLSRPVRVRWCSPRTTPTAAAPSSPPARCRSATAATASIWPARRSATAAHWSFATPTR